MHPETSLDSPELAAIRSAVRDILTAHEPNPAVVLDRRWNVVDASAGLSLFTEGIPEFLLTAPVNVVRLSLHPMGAAPRIVNLGQWRAYLLSRLRRQILRCSDPELAQLYTELSALPSPDAAADLTELPGPGDVVVPLRFRHRDQELAFFSTTAVFGTPLDMTVDELAIELFFPADPNTASYLRRRAT